MQYGYPDDAAREYVIETPATPLPWINYLGTAYRIHMTRTGERSITANDTTLESNIVPVPADGTQYVEVEVTF